MTPLAAPNAMANSAATNGDAPTNASMAKANATSVTAPRAIQSGWVRPASMKSTSRAATCAGPNRAPTATTVAASIPPRCSIASRFDVTPERMKKCNANAATSRMNGQPSGRIGAAGKAVEPDTDRQGCHGDRARQGEGIQRGDHKCQHGRKGQIGAAPAEMLQQQMRRRPAHGGGEAAGKRHEGDLPPGGAAEYPRQRREGRIVQRRRHRGADQQPACEIGRALVRHRQQHEAERARQRAHRHHDIAAVAVDQMADGR